MEPDHLDNIDYVPIGLGHIDETIFNENDNDQEIIQSDQTDSTILLSDEYQSARGRQRKQIWPSAMFNSDDFVSSFTYQEELDLKQAPIMMP